MSGKREEGTIMLMSLGLVIVLMLVVAAVVDVSAVYLARRDIVGSCDAAALASVQTAERNKVYGGTGIAVGVGAGLDPSNRLPLDGAAADAAAKQTARDIGGGMTVSLQAADTSVTVTCTRPVNLPLNAGFGSVTVTAQSDADTPLR